MKGQDNTLQSPCNFRAIGVMSGTSLDGLDLCLSDYNYNNNRWSFNIIKAETIPFGDKLRASLKNSMRTSGRELMLLDTDFGKWIGDKINKFLEDIDAKVDIIGSHGHTVFHEPSLGVSTQIGNGAHISAITGIPCVSNFRSGDVARGGQGAPLVPIGDELLFGNFDFCLNIGGIANISYKETGKRIAFDICPANMILNHLANSLGKDFDENGELGQAGNIDKDILDRLNQLPFYKKMGAKSLGREWFEESFLPIIESSNLPISHKIRTVYEHVSNQITESFLINPKGKVLITGGGAKNKFLIDLIKSKSPNEIVIPNQQIIDYKEALVFGMLAVLYQLGIPSSLSSVTGASEDSIGGCLYK